MLDIKFIRENAEAVKANCKNRLVTVDIDQLIEIDKKKRETETKIDELRAKRNELAQKAKGGKPAQEDIEMGRQLNVEVGQLESELEPLKEKLLEIILQVPNMTHPDVRVSDNEDDNPIVEIVGTPTEFDFEPLDHVELAANLDLIDFDRATKVSGAKFYYLKNELALLEFALIQYALDIAVKHKFTPFITPDIAKREVLEGLGFNPRGESTQVYNIENSDMCLVGTAEITMGGLHKDEILLEEELPKKYIAVSHCFRTEAGSYSKFSKGIFRVHQFTKIEMFQYVLPNKSAEAHLELLSIEKEIFNGLGLTYRVVDHCTADLGGPSIRTYDLEAWMPGKPSKEGKLGDWAEITSTSNCTDYQARGLNIKYKTSDNKKEFVHMLNGTAIAITRAIIAIMENYQQADGSIRIPDVLHGFIPGGIKVIKRK